MTSYNGRITVSMFRAHFMGVEQKQLIPIFHSIYLCRDVRRKSLILTS